MSGLYIDIVEPLDDQIAKLKRDNAALLAACKCQEALEKYDLSGNGFTRGDLEAVLVPYGVDVSTFYASVKAVQKLRKAAIAQAEAES